MIVVSITWEFTKWWNERTVAQLVGLQSNLDYLDLLGLDEIVRIIKDPDNQEYDY